MKDDLPIQLTPTISWDKGILKILDQTKLPKVEKYIETLKLILLSLSNLLKK